MKKKIFFVAFVTILVIFGLIWIHSDIFAQQDPGTEPNLPEEEIPFIDGDGDGINDFFQHGWGLRFLMRQNRLNELRGKLQNEGKKRGPILIDTDNDGNPDTPFHKYVQEKMNELIDTDGDGVPDTPLKEHIRKQYGTFDLNGNGIPDVATPEEIRQHLQEMNQWRQQIRERIEEGLPPFLDEDGDGIPDDLPPARQWMRGKHGKGNKNNNQ